MTAERELTEPVSLTRPDGTLNPDAVGWARRPLVDTSGIGGRHGWGRGKRWEYWSVVSPTHVLTLTVSSIDYAAVHSVWVFDRAMRRPRAGEATVLPSRGVRLAPSLGEAPAYARARNLAIAVEPDATGTRLRARIPGAEFDVFVTRPADRDCLAVVVPWTRRTFQYTVKDIGLPAAGSAVIDGVRHEVPAGSSWAVLDHGRGRWPYNVHWNWGAGYGESGGHRIGVQVGGRWTDGTGATENGVFVDGVLHKIDVELDWHYDLADWRRPWRVTGGGLDATFTPEYDRKASTNLGVVASRTDQCFGTWSGTFGDLAFDGLYGWAEDVVNRW